MTQAGNRRPDGQTARRPEKQPLFGQPFDSNRRRCNLQGCTTSMPRIATTVCIIHGLLNYLLPFVHELGGLVNVLDGPGGSGRWAAARKLPHHLEAGRLGENGRVRQRVDLVIHSVLKAGVSVNSWPSFRGQWLWNRLMKRVTVTEKLLPLDCSALIALHTR